VRLEHLEVALRPRAGWEALDLGFQMGRKWWRPIWSVWLALYLPAAAIALLLFSKPLHAVLALWWLKPLFDRAVLHVASRAVFGEPPGVRAALAAARDWLHPGLLAALTLYRFDLARSFALPVWQLEKQTGVAGQRRRRALGGRMRGYAVWLTVVCVHLEWVAMFALYALMRMLEPSISELGPDQAEPEQLAFWEAFGGWTLSDALYYFAAVCLIEPFYVSAGFSLYLNRRAILEGWDIELQLRRLEERLRLGARAACLVLATALIAGPAIVGPTPAHAAERSAQEEIVAVLESPEFSQYREITGWRYLGEERRKQRRWNPFWANLGWLFGAVAQHALWIFAAVALLLALFYLPRFIPEPRLRAEAYRPPAALFGLELAPQSLPADVAGSAARLAQEGRPREALSLLYRGALSALVHRHHVALAAGHTEADCMRAAHGALTPTAFGYFAELVRVWQSAAYAARTPEAALLQSLCEGWRDHFSPQAPS
jgi:hypothetical protein